MIWAELRNFKLVETSSNLASIEIGNDIAVIKGSNRSSNDSHPHSGGERLKAVTVEQFYDAVTQILHSIFGKK